MQTGAVATGLDYSATAISTARARNRLDDSQLQFIEADLNQVDLEAGCYHAAIAIDSIYWVSDVDQTIADITRLLSPGGQFLILIASEFGDGDEDADAGLQGTTVARALERLPLASCGDTSTRSASDFNLSVGVCNPCK